jgi:aminomethyltransferase
MGCFSIAGKNAFDLLQHLLSNDVAKLTVGQSQYSILANPHGGAVDDVYLYRFFEDKYLLVVNAANTDKDFQHIQSVKNNYHDVTIEPLAGKITLLALQGPQAGPILSELIATNDTLPARRNGLSTVTINDTQILVGRTGYTGEPVGFELFVPTAAAEQLWQVLIEHKATPVGLGARDTLRLEASLPLYGHELGDDMPVFACKQACFAVSFDSAKGDFIGRSALAKQYQALTAIKRKDYSLIQNLPQLIRPIALLGAGVARPDNEIFQGEKMIGRVTSGTMVPYWKEPGQTGMRAIALAMLDAKCNAGQKIAVQIRDKKIEAVIVNANLDNKMPPYAKPILWK